MQELEARDTETVLRVPFDSIVIEVQPRAGDAVPRRPGELVWVRQM
jgi:hypothetical protein